MQSADKIQTIIQDGEEFVLIPKGHYFELSDSEKIDIASKRVLDRHIEAFKELAKEND